jgi:hypothetical protein
MPNDDILNTINLNLIKILNKLDNLEERISNIELNGTSGKFNCINYLTSKYKDEKNFDFKKFGHIDVTMKEMIELYKKHTNMNNIIANKIIRNIHNFEGIHCFAKTKRHDIFIKANNVWRLLTIQDMNSIIMFIKIACFKCTKTFKYKTRQERDVIDNLDKLMSSENTATMLELVKKNIYNTIKE